jgi:hypothetical protein
MMATRDRQSPIAGLAAPQDSQSQSERFCQSVGRRYPPVGYSPTVNRSASGVILIGKYILQYIYYIHVAVALVTIVSVRYLVQYSCAPNALARYSNCNCKCKHHWSPRDINRKIMIRDSSKILG